jgi:hypothetical protein
VTTRMFVRIGFREKRPLSSGREDMSKWATSLKLQDYSRQGAERSVCKDVYASKHTNHRKDRVNETGMQTI